MFFPFSHLLWLYLQETLENMSSWVLSRSVSRRSHGKIWGHKIVLVFLNAVWCYLCWYSLSSFYWLPNSFQNFFFLRHTFFRFILSLLASWMSHTHILCILSIFPLTKRFSVGYLKPLTMFKQVGDDHIQDLRYTRNIP